MHTHKNTIKSMSIVFHKYTCCRRLVKKRRGQERESIGMARTYGTPSVTKIKGLYRHIRSLFRAEIRTLFRAEIRTLFRAEIKT